MAALSLGWGMSESSQILIIWSGKSPISASTWKPLQGRHLTSTHFAPVSDMGFLILCKSLYFSLLSQALFLSLMSELKHKS